MIARRDLFPDGKGKITGIIIAFFLKKELLREGGGKEEFYGLDKRLFLSRERIKATFQLNSVVGDKTA